MAYDRRRAALVDIFSWASRLATAWARQWNGTRPSRGKHDQRGLSRLAAKCPRGAKPLPVVVLSATAGLASSVVEFVTGIGNLLYPSKPYPLWFHSLWLDVPGGTRPFALAVSMIVCSYFDANPIVPGTTGSALQVPH